MEPKHTELFSPVTERPLDELLGAMKMDHFAERISLDVYLTSLSIPPKKTFELLSHLAAFLSSLFV